MKFINNICTTLTYIYKYIILNATHAVLIISYKALVRLHIFKKKNETFFYTSQRNKNIKCHVYNGLSKI